MPKAGKTVLGRQHRVKRLEGPATPGSEVVKAGVAKAPRAGGKKKAATTAAVAAAPKQAGAAPVVSGESKVLYIGHIPHGFYEKEMRGFFSQFGDVTRVRMSRNKKTGASKHYAWVEFKHASVAKIAADTMDNYLMFDKVLKVKLVPASALHPATFKGANTRFVPHVSTTTARMVHNAKRDALGVEKQAATLVKREAKRRAKIAASGIEYQFQGYTQAAVTAPPGPAELEAAQKTPAAAAAAAAAAKRPRRGEAAAAAAAAATEPVSQAAPAPAQGGKAKIAGKRSAPPAAPPAAKSDAKPAPAAAKKRRQA